MLIQHNKTALNLSLLPAAKNRKYLSSLEPILQHFEHIKVENQLKMPRTVVTHCKKKAVEVSRKSSIFSFAGVKGLSTFLLFTALSRLIRNKLFLIFVLLQPRPRLVPEPIKKKDQLRNTGQEVLTLQYRTPKNYRQDIALPHLCYYQIMTVIAYHITVTKSLTIPVLALSVADPNFNHSDYSRTNIKKTTGINKNCVHEFL